MYKSILVGTDGSPTAARAVDRAVQVAAATGANLTIVSVGAKDQAQATAEAEATRHEGVPVPITPRGEEGDPASVLVELAEQEDFDLLVVGNKGMTGVSRFLLGSVPNKVSHHTPCALLIVRTT